MRVNTPVCSATSCGVPRCTRPPTPAYSPSLFSRTHTMSMSADVRPASGPDTPGINRIGRRFTYCSNRCRIGRMSSHTDTWSGTDGCADGAEKDGVGAPELLQRVGRHHAAGLTVEVASPRMILALERDTSMTAHRVEHTQGRGRHFLADAVTRDDGDAMA